MCDLKKLFGMSLFLTALFRSTHMHLLSNFMDHAIETICLNNMGAL